MTIHQRPVTEHPDIFARTSYAVAEIIEAAEALGVARLARDLRGMRRKSAQIAELSRCLWLVLEGGK